MNYSASLGGVEDGIRIREIKEVFFVQRIHFHQLVHFGRQKLFIQPGKREKWEDGMVVESEVNKTK